MDAEHWQKSTVSALPMFKNRLYKWGLLLGICALAAGWIAWGYYQSRYPSWYEEVRLSDGRIITIHQKHEYFENYGTNQSWVEIDLPELGGKRVWHSYLMPQRVDVQQGVVYVFGRPRGPRQISYYQYPKNHMVALKWTGTEFVRIPFLQVPEKIRQAENVYPCIPTPKLSIVTIKAKDDKWCEPTGDKGQFSKLINLYDYQQLAIQFARLDGGLPISD